MTDYIKTLTNGVATDWMDASPFVSLELQGKVTGVVTVIIEGSNDTQAKTEPVQYGSTFSADFAKALFQPMPKLIRLRQSAGAGSVIVSFGNGVTPKNEIVPVTKQGVKAGGPSSELFNS